MIDHPEAARVAENLRHIGISLKASWDENIVRRLDRLEAAANPRPELFTDAQIASIEAFVGAGVHRHLSEFHVESPAPARESAFAFDPKSPAFEAGYKAGNVVGRERGIREALKIAWKHAPTAGNLTTAELSGLLKALSTPAARVEG